MVNQSRRSALIEQFFQKKRQSDIVRQLKVPQPTVSQTIARYRSLGTFEEHKRSGRSRAANTPVNRGIIRKRITRNSRVFMRKIARETGISDKTIRFFRQKTPQTPPIHNPESPTPHRLNEDTQAPTMATASAAGRR